VIIVGGGLAGLSLAIQLANGKRKVLLLEKNKYPFHRVCGEYISMESWDFLERIGLPLREMNLPRINRLRVSSVSGKVIDHPLDLGGFGISRYTLDHQLALLAKEKGVAVLEGAHVKDILREDQEELFTVNMTITKDLLRAEETVITSKYDTEVFAPVVVGAFGKRSNLDNKLNREFERTPSPPSKNWIGVKYHVTDADLPSDRIELHNFLNGYCGISKVDGEKFCLCYLTKAENLRRSEGSIEKMEEEILSQNSFLKNYFADRKKFLFKEPVTISQITFEKKMPVEKNILMVGDAAGMIAPLCGNGMSMAFHSSAIAFPIIERFLRSKLLRDQMEKEYAAQWRKLFSARLEFGRMIQPLLVKPSLSNPSISLLKNFPFAMNAIVSLTHGKSF